MYLKSLSLGLFSALMVLGGSQVWAFTDIPANKPVARYIDFLSQRKILQGYSDNTFRPDKPVTRAEFAAIIVKSGLAQNAENETNDPFAFHHRFHRFRDVSRRNWAAADIQAMVTHGLISGYPGHRFRPDRDISMAEITAIFKKINPGAASLTAGEQPNKPATRAEVAALVAKLLNPDFKTSTDIKPMPNEAMSKSPKPIEAIRKIEKKVTVANSNEANSTAGLYMMQSVPPIRPLWVLSVPVSGSSENNQANNQSQLRSVSVVRETPSQPISILSTKQTLSNNANSFARRSDALAGPQVLP